MNANIKVAGSAGLSVQPQVIICPKCQHKRTADERAPAWQCPSCGVAYNKARAPSPPLASQVNNAPRANGDREIDLDELETATPPMMSLSMAGRIGRLRYLAFSWPIFALGSLLAMMAAVVVPQHKASGMILLILAAVLCLWMPLRLMAMRFHDVNLSAKWVLALLLFPGLAGAVGASHMVVICAGFFWVAAIVLVALPGSESENDFGPPPGDNTTAVKVGAGVVLFLMALGVIGNIRLMNSGKLNSVLSRDQRTAAEAQQSAPLTKSAFVGTWEGRNMSLRVDQNGYGDFFHFDGRYSIRATGPLRVLDDNRISIGFGPDPHLLNVTVPPHVESNVAKMTIDGVEMVGTS